MALDQIGIITVNDPEQFMQRIERNRMLPAAKGCLFLDYSQGNVMKLLSLFGIQGCHFVYF
jgi:hypothetical protein